MKLIRPESSAHWYTHPNTTTGEKSKPMHKITGANGNERPTTLRDARKLNLLPSVTSVLGIIAKPQLESWKQEQAILAALTLPRNAGEELDAFARRVVEDMNAQVGAACEFGTRIHAAIESANAERFNGAPAVCDRDLLPWVNEYLKWSLSNVGSIIDAESIVAHGGYAGRFDLLARHTVHGEVLIDFKTQNCKEGKANFYDAWAWQLAAYRFAMNSSARCLSVVIDSNSPSAPQEKLWSEDEIKTGWCIFRAALEIWQQQRGYVPNPSSISATIIEDFRKLTVANGAGRLLAGLEAIKTGKAEVAQ